MQGNGYIIIGTQKGNLMVYSLLTGQLVHTFEQAHKDQVTGITLLKRHMPYGDMASVGLDKRLVVYEFELSSDEKSKLVWFKNFFLKCLKKAEVLYYHNFSYKKFFVQKESLSLLTFLMFNIKSIQKKSVF